MNFSFIGITRAGPRRRGIAPTGEVAASGTRGDREGYAAPRDEVPRRVSRRRILGWAVSAGGSLVLTGTVTPVAWARRTATGRRPLYGLDPAAHDGKGCVGCRACRRHAANKVFPTARAARLGRAHPHCSCRVIRLPLVSPATWRALFVRRDGTVRVSVDRRTRSVHRTLGRHVVRRTR